MPYAPSATWQALGLGTSGMSLDSTGWGRGVIDTIPPMPFSYTNQSFAEPPVQCSEHTSMARDQCMPANLAAAAIAATAPGSRLFAPYLRRFCYACEPGICP